MSDLEHRWRRLVAASRSSPGGDPPPPSTDFVERVARAGLAARTAIVSRAEGRRPEPRAWAALLAMSAAGILALVSTRGSVRDEAAALAEELAVLPRHVPAAPELPPAFTLPPAREALALIPDGPGLRSALGLPPRTEDTP